MATSASCLGLWRAENDRLVQRWRRRVTRPPDSDSSVKLTAQECHVAFTELLQKIQGLPAVLSALPLELTVLSNSLLFSIHLSNNFGKKISVLIEQGLKRVLEACAVSNEDLCSEDLWPRVLQQNIPEELQASLHHLIVLQGTIWLASNQLDRVKELFQLLPGAKSPGLSFVGCDNELLSLLQAWHPCGTGESDPLVVQSIRDMKDILWTSAAFLQGVQELEADNLHGALAFLQVAATGLCSKRVLAQIFTLMGTCHQRIGNPQLALQHLKQALQVDFTFLPALDLAALLYRQLDLVEAELEALALLYQALEDNPVQENQEFNSPCFLVQTELLTCGFHPTAVFVQSSPSGVKYMLAERCMQAGKTSEAAEHYLDLLALFQEGPLPQVFLNNKLAMPRIPEVFLEAASALEEVGRHLEAIMVCEEVVSRTSELVPKRLPVVLGSSSEESVLGMERSSSAKPPGIILKQQRESLHCVLWRAAAYLIQGSARAQLGEAKEAISNFSRCLNDLLKIQVVGTGSQRTEQEREEMATPEAELLSQIRHLALTGRGAQFLGLGKDKEALMDFQHSLHFSPGGAAASLYLLYTLWKLNRKQEVAAHWQKLHSEPGLMEEDAERLFPLYLRSCVKQMAFPHKDSFTKDLKSSLRILPSCGDGFSSLPSQLPFSSSS